MWSLTTSVLQERCVLHFSTADNNYDKIDPRQRFTWIQRMDLDSFSLSHKWEKSERTTNWHTVSMFFVETYSSFLPFINLFLKWNNQTFHQTTTNQHFSSDCHGTVFSLNTLQWSGLTVPQRHSVKWSAARHPNCPRWAWHHVTNY